MGYDHSQAIPRGDGDIEPMAFHAMPEELYDSLGKTYNIAGWIDLFCHGPHSRCFLCQEPMTLVRFGLQYGIPQFA